MKITARFHPLGEFRMREAREFLQRAVEREAQAARAMDAARRARAAGQRVFALVAEEAADRHREMAQVAEVIAIEKIAAALP